MSNETNDIIYLVRRGLITNQEAVTRLVIESPDLAAALFRSFCETVFYPGEYAEFLRCWRAQEKPPEHLKRRLELAIQKFSDERLK